MSGNRSTKRYNTATTLTQLGAVLPRQPLDHQGVLAPPARVAILLQFGSWRLPSSAVWKPRRRQAWTSHQSIATRGSARASFSRGYVDSKVHDAHIALIQDTLNQAQSPAMALQVLLMGICQMTYYDMLLRIEESKVAEAAFSQEQRCFRLNERDSG
ncbi:hypothetical protein N7463_001300 [Penicillium fimorum]|uniref:Uncharacterized protein n=1 Tax=Penicillium fimorum TaxID=1882269 RepID=A0A9W9Y5V4_9EURO|nr:hypothetical protein N7463_001300 [Penicillium fimorum]